MRERVDWTRTKNSEKKLGEEGTSYSTRGLLKKRPRVRAGKGHDRPRGRGAPIVIGEALMR